MPDPLAISSAPTMRETFAKNRRVALIAIAPGALIAGTAVTLGVTGHLTPWAWIPLAALFTWGLTGDIYQAVRMTKALHVYDSNPAAAYIAEMRRAFGTTTP